MKLNTITLARVIKELPEPAHRGQVLQWKFPSRVVELNRDEPLSLDTSTEGLKATMYLRIQFEAVEYARGRLRWLEWELVA